MPVLTKAQMQMQYVHVMDILTQRDHATSALAKALERHFGQGNSLHQDVDNILGLTQDEIDGLEYESQVPDPNDSTRTIPKTTPLPRGDRGIIQVLLGFRLWMRNQGKDILPNKWTDVTFDKFCEYRITHHWSMMNKRANIGSPGVTSSATSNTTSSTTTGRKLQSEIF